MLLTIPVLPTATQPAQWSCFFQPSMEACDLFLNFVPHANARFLISPRSRQYSPMVSTLVTNLALSGVRKMSNRPVPNSAKLAFGTTALAQENFQAAWPVEHFPSGWG